MRCFINSDIPPHLHIDITPEQADKIVDNPSREMGPYVFREAQVRSSTEYKRDILPTKHRSYNHWSDRSVITTAKI